MWGGDPGAQRYSSLTGITPENVAALRPAWSWSTGEQAMTSAEVGAPARPNKFEATPVMLGDTLYLSTSYNRAVALDANTGRELWQFDPGAARAGQIGDNRSGFVHRGVAVWSGEGERRVFLNARWQLFALDARTGRPVPSFGRDGAVDLTQDLRWPVNRYEYANTSPPVIWRNLVVVGSSVNDKLIHDRDPPGDVQAFDAMTGRRVWRWDPVPGPGTPGSETWQDRSNERTGHANVWAPFTVDTARGLLYLPVSSASNDWYGGRRLGAGLYGESLVCLDAETGRVVWHFQLQHHGLWDYDPPSAPVLVRLVADGRSIDAVAIAGKTGFLYVFDRVTGRPVWPIEERPVPASNVPGEVASLTQPFPTRPPPFSRQGFSDSDVVNFTPDLAARARRMLDTLRLGPMFTPPSLEGTVVMPGSIGGSGWGGGAFDSSTHTFFVKASNQPMLGRVGAAPDTGATAGIGYRLDPPDGNDVALRVPLATRTGPLKRFGSDIGIPIVRPPYGTLTAIDLDRGEIRWQVTLGDTRSVRFHRKLRSLKLPPLGVAGAPGPLATAGGLIFITGGGDVFYALESTTGTVRWSWELGTAGYSNPMIYRTAAGREYVVLATGTGEDARLVAFALPAGKD